jgi:hypothetical protein
MTFYDWWRHILLGAPPPPGFSAHVRPLVTEPQKPLDVDDVLDAHNRLEQVQNLRDLGVGGLMWWRVAATCSRHGLIVRYEETTGGPPDLPSLSCVSCRREGVSRSCLVDQLEIVVGRELPLVGENSSDEQRGREA